MTDLFQDIIGHRRVLELLESELVSPTQAYLFTGPQSVGKATVALRFAAGLVCPTGGVHDGECRSCRLALAGTHPDLRMVEPEGAASLGVDQVREVVSRAALTPVESERTVFLFPEAGAMTDSAANSLLKTLEEPSASVAFLLVSEAEEDLPPTVASRCRTVHMGRVESDEIVAGLRAKGVEGDRAEGVAAVAGGRPGLAIALMSQPKVARFRELWLSIPSQVTPHPGDGQRLASEVLAELAPLVADAVPEGLTKERTQRAKRRAEMSLLIGGLEILASWYADAASLQMGGPIRNTDVELTALTEVSPRKAVSAAELILDAVVDIQLNLRRELVLANLFAALGEDDG